MKLKKLLPIATIVGTASIIAPLVTSCGKQKSADLEWSMYDGEYVLSDNQLEAANHEHSYVEQIALNKQYVEDVVDDWSIFTNDYAYAYLYLLPLVQFAGEVFGERAVNIEFQMHNVKLHVNNIEKDNDNGEGQIFRASFDIYSEGYVWVDITYADEDDNEHVISLSLPISIDLECKNIPYSGGIIEVTEPTPDVFYGIGLISNFVADDEWEFTSTIVDYTSSVTKTYTNEEIPTAIINYDWRSLLSLSLFDFGWTQSALSTGSGYITLPSWYMFNQTFTA